MRDVSGHSPSGETVSSPLIMSTTARADLNPITLLPTTWLGWSYGFHHSLHFLQSKAAKAGGSRRVTPSQ